MAKIGIFTKIFRNEAGIVDNINSILNQSYGDFHYYILVSDDTYEVIRKITSDTRIILIHNNDNSANFNNYFRRLCEENEYIMTVDGDDLLHANCLEYMMKEVEESGAEYVAVGNTFEEKGKPTRSRVVEKTVRLNRLGVYNYLPYLYQFLRTSWGKLWKSELFDGIANTPTSMHLGGYGGDTMLCFFMLERTEKISFLPYAGYRYMINSDSISHKIKPGRLDSDAALFNYVYEYMRKNKVDTKENMIFLYAIYKHALLDTMRLISAEPDVDKRIPQYEYVLSKERTQELLSLCNDPAFKNSEINADAVRRFVVAIASSSPIDDRFYSVFNLLCRHSVGNISKSLYETMLTDGKLLSAYLNLDTSVLIEALTDGTDERVKENARLFVEENTQNVVLKKWVRELDLPKQKEIIKLAYFNRNDEVCMQIKKELNENSACDREVFWAMLSDFAAISEDADTFIEAKSGLMTYYEENGDENKSEAIRKELLEMGVLL